MADLTVELLPNVDPPLFRDAVTVRCHSVWGFLRLWRGSITERTWPKVLAYTAYVAGVTALFTVGCPDKHDAKGEGEGEGRCFLATKALHLEGMLALWMAFTAYLFTSFVNSALARYRATLGQVRSFQGRINELSLLLHSYANPRHGDGTTNDALAAALRLMDALTLVMYARPALAGSEARAEEFLTRAASHLTQKEAASLVAIPVAGNRPLAIMLWINRLVLDNVDKTDGPATAAFRDPDASCSGAVVSCMERLRGAYGTLIDSLDDAILPLPFAQLTVTNVYLIFLLLPYAMIHELGYSIIPACAIYFWFLDGMITFVFFVDQPFSDQAVIKKKVQHPLINVYTAINESLKSTPVRFPLALVNEPKNHSD